MHQEPPQSPPPADAGPCKEHGSAIRSISDGAGLGIYEGLLFTSRYLLEPQKLVILRPRQNINYYVCRIPFIALIVLCYFLPKKNHLEFALQL